MTEFFMKNPLILQPSASLTEYTLVDDLPSNLKGALPTAKEVECDLHQPQEVKNRNSKGNCL
jgi:hypothetical protein